MFVLQLFYLQFISMQNLNRIPRKIKIVFFVILILTPRLYSQTQNENINQNNEITIFIIPSLSPIDWSNPRSVFKSTEICFLNVITRKNYYIIGHTIARISSPLLPAPFFVAMSGKKQTEKPELVMIKKVGFGVMGSTMHGHIESEKSIKRGIELYSKRNKVAYIKFRINEQSVRRLLEFIDRFQKKTIAGFAPCDLYNGATWPRYENEGSGCSGFGMSLLDVAHLLSPQSKEWSISVKIPMNLIGGEFNNNKKIKFSDILRTKSWYNGTGVKDVDYINYKVYEPNFIFDWILNKRSQNDLDFLPDEENGIPGLIVDRRNVVIDADEPVFLQRTDSDLFVRHYHNRIRSLLNKKTPN